MPRLTKLDRQQNIIVLVDEYKRVFPEEYEAVKALAKQKRSLAATKFAELKGGGMVERALLELPETLVTIFQTKLPKDEYAWLFSGSSKEGIRFLAKKYPEFLACDKV